MLFLVDVRYDIKVDLIAGELSGDDVIMISAESENVANALLKEFFHSKVLYTNNTKVTDIFYEPTVLPGIFDEYYDSYANVIFNYSLFHIEYDIYSELRVIKYTYEN